MQRLFMDESGECSFSLKSDNKHFVISIISIDSTEIDNLKNVLKRKFSAIIQKGWNKEIEIKASSLFAKSNFGPKSVKNVLGFIRSLESIEIHYMVVNKIAIENESFRNAPYGIAYNYFAGHLLEHIIFDNKVHDFQLI